MNLLEIQEKLSFLRTCRRELADRYPPPSPLLEETVQALEARLNIRLPEDFRTYITTIGNGGIGPYCGISDDILGREKHVPIKPFKFDNPYSDSDWFDVETGEKVVWENPMDDAQNVRADWRQDYLDRFVQPFDWHDLIQVKKYTPQEFEQRKKAEMLGILQANGRYVKPQSPTLLQRKVKTWYDIDLEEDQYLKFGKLKGCLNIGFHRHVFVYLIVSGDANHLGRVLLHHSGGEKGQDSFYQLKGPFGAFYLEWLDGMISGR